MFSLFSIEYSSAASAPDSIFEFAIVFTCDTLEWLASIDRERDWSLLEVDSLPIHFSKDCDSWSFSFNWRFIARLCMIYQSGEMNINKTRLHEINYENDVISNLVLRSL